MDDRDLRGGEKKWQWVKKGVPVRAEVGPRDVQGGKVAVGRRDVNGKPEFTPRAQFIADISKTLEEIQTGLFDRAAALRKESTVQIDSFEEFQEFFSEKSSGGLAYCHFVDTPDIEEKMKPLKVTARCVPVDGEEEAGTCIFTGEKSTKRGVLRERTSI